MELCRSRTVAFTLAAVAMGLPGVVCGDTVFAPENLRLVPRNGVEAKAGVLPATEGQAHTLRIEFEKPGDVRRMVTVTGTVPPGMAGRRVLVVDGRLHLSQGEPPHLCAVLFGRDGQRWIRKGEEIRPAAGQSSWPLSVARMQTADFAETDAGAVTWPAVERIWLGLVFAGPAKGHWDVAGVRLTDDPPPALTPAALMTGGATGWQLHHDAAVKAQLTTSGVGPNEQAAMRVTYTFPGGRHMFCTCSLAVPAEQPELYRAVRLTYRASFPPGITGLLFILAEESGACYLATPTPGPSAQWRSVTVPYAALKCASWTPDPNSRFDPETLTTVWVGTHGTATGEGGPGEIEVAAVELVP